MRNVPPPGSPPESQTGQGATQRRDALRQELVGAKESLRAVRATLTYPGTSEANKRNNLRPEAERLLGRIADLEAELGQ